MADIDPRYNVDDALLVLGFGKFQWLVLLYAGMGWISEAMEMMLLSFVGPSVKSQWNLTSDQESFITTVVFAGMLIGAYSWGLVSDRFGRRRGFLVTAIVTSASGFMSAVAPNYVTLLICRFVVGLGLGGGPVLFAWFLEFVPAPHRGFWMVVFQALWSIGTVVEAALAWIVIPRLGWRWLLGLSAVPSLFLLIFYGITPESLRYLCLKGKEDEAHRILEKIAKLNRKEVPCGVLVTKLNRKEVPCGVLVTTKAEVQGKSLLPETAPLLVSDSGDDENVTCSQEKEAITGPINSLLLLLSPELIRSTLLMWIVFFGNLFSYYGLVLLSTELSTGSNECGQTKMLSQSSGGVNYADVFITSLAEFPAYILASVTVDILGRKLSMVAFSVASSIFLLPLVVHRSTGLTTALLFGGRASVTASFTIVYLYAPEIYPTSVRSTGVGIASSIGRVGGAVCPLVAISLVQGCHQAAAVLLFVGVIIVSGVCSFFFPLETKGRPLVDRLAFSSNPK